MSFTHFLETKNDDSTKISFQLFPSNTDTRTHSNWNHISFFQNMVLARQITTALKEFIVKSI